MFWRLAVRGMLQRPGRAVLTLLSIVIGVAAVVAVHLTSNATRGYYRQMCERLTGRASLEVVSEIPPQFLLAQGLVTSLEQVPGVEAAVPTLSRQASVRLGTSRHFRQVTGIDPAREPLARDYRVAAGRWLTAQDEGMLLEEGLAQSLGVSLSDEARFILPRRMKVPIVGVLAPQMAGFTDSSIVLPLKLAQEYFDCPGQVSAIRLVLRKDSDVAAAQKAIQVTLPEGVTVRPTAEQAQLGGNPFETAERGLQFGCALMVALAIFVVLNTFLMNLGERQGHLAILRAVGATRRQVTQLLLAESLAMGVVGALLGSLVGVAGAHVLGWEMSQLVPEGAIAIQLSLFPFVLAWLVGISVALLATLIPLRRASRISPMAALRAAGPRDPGQVSRRTTVGGVVLFAVAGLVVGACLLDWLPIVLAIPAGVTFLAAFALVIPALLQPLGYVLSFVVRPTLGVEGGLAEEQLARRRARAGLTVGVLYIAIGAGVGLGTTITNNVNDVRRWYRLIMQGDFLVHDGLISESLERQIRQVAGVTSVEGIHDFFSDLERQRISVIGRDFNSDPFPLILQEGLAERVREKLRAGEVVVGTRLAQQLGLAVGDRVTLRSPQGPQEFRIAGTTVDYFYNGRVVYLQRSILQDRFQLRDAKWLVVRTRPDQREAVLRQVRTLCQESGLLVSSNRELSDAIDSTMSGIVHGLWGLLALGFLVAGFGIGNTLMMNVLEQTREIALLRVIGMTRWQVRKMILAQALILGVVGLGLGVLAGVNTAYLMNRCLQPLVGRSVPFAIPAALILISFLTALLVVLLAAWIPANRAAKLHLLIALQYE